MLDGRAISLRRVCRLTELMIGERTVGGTVPVKYVSPRSTEYAKLFLKHINRYFDYANHENVRLIINLYFDNGYPLEVPLSGIMGDLGDLRTMRNASAHLTSTTQAALEALALRIFGQPQAGIALYQLLTANDPRGPAGETVFVSYKDKLLVTAELIANG